MTSIAQLRVKLSKELSDFVGGLGGTTLKVGIPGNIAYEDGKLVADAAIENEFGSGRIPARPFLRPTFDEKHGAWEKAIVSSIKRAFAEGRSSIDEELAIVGESAAGDVRRTISRIWTPPLSKMTIQNRLERLKKKSVTKSLTKPLVDTGLLISSISYEVVNRD